MLSFSYRFSHEGFPIVLCCYHHLDFPCIAQRQCLPPIRPDKLSVYLHFCRSQQDPLFCSVLHRALSIPASDPPTPRIPLSSQILYYLLIVSRTHLVTRKPPPPITYSVSARRCSTTFLCPSYPSPSILTQDRPFRKVFSCFSIAPDPFSHICRWYDAHSFFFIRTRLLSPVRLFSAIAPPTVVGVCSPCFESTQVWSSYPLILFR